MLFESLTLSQILPEMDSRVFPPFNRQRITIVYHVRMLPSQCMILLVTLHGMEMQFFNSSTTCRSFQQCRVLHPPENAGGQYRASMTDLQSL